jgi:hypothetical protein
MGDWASALARNVLDLHKRLRKSAAPLRKSVVTKVTTEKEATMPISNPATAAMGFDTYCTTLAKRDGISKSAAQLKALGDPTGRALFQMGRAASAADVLKLGGDGLPQGGPHHDSYGPTIPTPQRARRVGALDYAGNHDGGEDDDELSAAAHDQHERNVRTLMRDHGMTESKARDEAMKRFPDTWKAAKQHRPVTHADLHRGIPEHSHEE